MGAAAAEATGSAHGLRGHLRPPARGRVDPSAFPGDLARRLAHDRDVRVRGDRYGKIWVAVRTPSTRVGYVAAWLVRFRGKAHIKATTTLRTGGSRSAHSLGKVPRGARVTVIGSWADSKERVWFRIRTGTGRVGWVASWKTRP